MRISTVGRHLREGYKNLSRNSWMSFAAVGAVSVSLFILGVFLLLAMNVSYMAEKLEEQVEIRVFVDELANENEVEAIDAKLRSLVDVKEVVFISKEEGLEILKKGLGEESSVLDGLENENPLRDAFYVKSFHPRQVGDLAKKIEKIPFVAEVKYGRDTVEALFSVTTIVRNVGLIFSIGLAFTSLFLIANTIRLTIYARRKEIEIMKLCGATNWFIRWPFFLEGMWMGFLGSLLPILLIGVGYFELLRRQKTSIYFLELMPFDPFIYQLAILLTGSGVFIGVIGSMMSVRRFLKI
ncbi:cell division protein FtsX [Desulfuribacillus stibiiarsenatis]|uniref:Cell division protein FtsX n=1 Tax=Desulfuribacillus stibiiarsenatis TaxID=1390249 RepID=A0A1E5L9T8_9FIRM|nr:permease-like cell division protein FtsX [Desulfuribacillus stibiiarsenatis]OEH86794.1 cell division protein FtsX [Desulfuribacillus stibiiarsenatis]